MSISSLTNAQAPTENRRPAARRGEPAGSSFQEQLVQSAAKAQSAQKAAASPGREAFMKDSLLTALSGVQRTMLDRMKLSKEKKEEQEDWDRIMKALDAWIESLREEADVEKTARAYASLQAAQADAESERKDLGDYILEQLSQRLAG